jgi:hypothetical protein
MRLGIQKAVSFGGEQKDVESRKHAFPFPGRRSQLSLATGKCGWLRKGCKCFLVWKLGPKVNIHINRGDKVASCLRGLWGWEKERKC